MKTDAGRRLFLYGMVVVERKRCVAQFVPTFPDLAGTEKATVPYQEAGHLSSSS